VVLPQPFHLPTSRGPRFCVRYEPPGGSAGSRPIVHVPAFAEEMNKSRRMVALAARALAAQGWTVIQPDPLGCGDSDGDTGDARWSQWIADVVDAARWAQASTGRPPALWGLRVGCLLAREAADLLEVPTDLLLWHPVLSGAQALTQFLRLKVTGQLVGAKATERVGARELIASLERGNVLEVAGYALDPGLALGLQASELVPPRRPASVAWLEIGSDDAAGPGVAAQARIDAFRAAGHAVQAGQVACPPFWQTQEIAQCPALVEATLAALARWPA